MKWSDVGKAVAKIGGHGATLAAKVLTGNIPEALDEVATWISEGLGTPKDPDAVLRALQGNPDAVVKVQEILANKEIRLRELAVNLETAQMTSDTETLKTVNETIRADIGGQSWLQRNTHSVMKLWLAGLVTMIYFVLPLSHREVPHVPETVWIMFGAILGIKSWHDGQRKTEVVKTVRKT